MLTNWKLKTKMSLFKHRKIIDLIWLALLGLFVFAGMNITSFHGDEPMQIYMSRDYATAFIFRAPERLISAGPYDFDTDAQLRLINGSVNRYAIGLSWHLAGFAGRDLPPRPGWNWGMDYESNIASGNRPSEGMVSASRSSSTLFLALSVAAMFGIGWQFSGRPAAYIASGLYAVNPVILINGRRAMMEGSLLLFGLLTIFVALVISKRYAEEKRIGWQWWLGLILSGALAIASKHSGLVFVGGALGWVFLTALLGRRWRSFAIMTASLIISGLLICALFVGLSPGLWGDTPARLQDLIEERTKLIDIQVNGDPNAPMSTTDKLEKLITEPYISPPAHFEVGGWTDFSVISEEIARYMNSPLSGLQFGPVLGGALMLLAVAGMIVVLWRGPVYRYGVFIWLAGTVAMLMVNPLPWQRYYLPLIPIVTLFTTMGIMTLVAMFVHRPEQESRQSPIASEDVQPQTIK